MNIVVSNVEFLYDNGYGSGATGVVVGFTSYNTTHNSRNYISGSITMTIEEYNSYNGSSFDSFTDFVKSKIIEKLSVETNQEPEPETEN